MSKTNAKQSSNRSKKGRPRKATSQSPVDEEQPKLSYEEKKALKLKA